MDTRKDNIESRALVPWLDALAKYWPILVGSAGLVGAAIMNDLRHQSEIDNINKYGSDHEIAYQKTQQDINEKLIIMLQNQQLQLGYQEKRLTILEQKVK